MSSVLKNAINSGPEIPSQASISSIKDRKFKFNPKIKFKVEDLSMDTWWIWSLMSKATSFREEIKSHLRENNFLKLFNMQNKKLWNTD